MRKLSLDEVKRLELDLLVYFDKICKKNKLSYFLCGGTLLGAVRHKGFIPWDDDIDVLVPRKDFEKLLRMSRHQKQDSRYRIISWKSGDSPYPFIKLVDTKTVVKEKYYDEKYKINIWIDVFPLDGMPDDDKYIKRTFRKSWFYRTILFASISEKGKGVTFIARIAKFFLIPICKRISNKWLCDKINYISSRHDVESSPYVGGFLWGYGPQEKMPKSFLNPVDVEFEGHVFPAPECWDYYLSQLYGDYMTLPPKEKQEFHDFDAWIMDE